MNDIRNKEGPKITKQCSIQEINMNQILINILKLIRLPHTPYHDTRSLKGNKPVALASKETHHEECQTEYDR